MLFRSSLPAVVEVRRGSQRDELMSTNLVPALAPGARTDVALPIPVTSMNEELWVVVVDGENDVNPGADSFRLAAPIGGAPVIDRVRLESDGTLVLLATAPAGFRYVLEASENLRDWTSIKTISLPVESLEFRVTPDPARRYRLFRVRKSAASQM